MPSDNQIESAVILCGGRGTRMGSLAEERPKSLLDVHGRPILWYILARLLAGGLKRFVLPVGHLGDQITRYADEAFGDAGCEIHCIDTGTDSPIGSRLAQVRGLIPPGEDFFLTNGDALFDFDIAGMFAKHRSAGAAITFATAQTVSKYGLVVLENGRVTGFERQTPVASFLLDGDGGSRNGYVYTGMAVLNEAALDMIDLAGSTNFEADLFPKLVAEHSAAHFPIDGFWHAIDTPKDLAAANAGSASEPLFSDPARHLKIRLEMELAARHAR